MAQGMLLYWQLWFFLIIINEVVILLHLFLSELCVNISVCLMCLYCCTLCQQSTACCQAKVPSIGNKDKTSNACHYAENAYDVTVLSVC